MRLRDGEASFFSPRVCADHEYIIRVDMRDTWLSFLSLYSCIRISSILMAQSLMMEPGPKMQAAPAL